MIITILFVYAGIFMGMSFPWYAFVGAALFDIAMAETIFVESRHGWNHE